MFVSLAILVISLDESHKSRPQVLSFFKKKNPNLSKME